MKCAGALIEIVENEHDLFICLSLVMFNMLVTIAIPVFVD